jgi:MFS family permease
VFGAGLAIFTTASLLCAIAPDALFLNLARAVQGVGGAAMFAVSLALIAQEFAPGRERGTAMASTARRSAWASRSGRSSAAR